MDVIDVKVTRSPLWAADGVVTTMGRASDQSVISHPPLANGGRWLAGWRCDDGRDSSQASMTRTLKKEIIFANEPG